MSDQINVTRSSLPPMDEYIQEIAPLWETRWLSNAGDKHQALEAALCQYLGVERATLFCNGHQALEAALQVFEFPAGSEVITSPFTFASTTQAIIHSGLTPVFADIDPKLLTLDPACIEPLITERTVAILPIHVYGRLCDVEGIRRLAERFGLKVIYDAAHAFGELQGGRSIADCGDVSMFSFHATKVFHSIEGGALVYGDPALQSRFIARRNFGMVSEEDVLYVSGNGKMNEFQAAMGLCNLRHVESYIESRLNVLERYRVLLDSVPGLRLPDRQIGVRENGAYFPVFFDGGPAVRDAAREALCAGGVMSRKYFYPLTSEMVFVTDRFRPQPTPIAKRVADSVLCLPIYEGLRADQQQAIADILKVFLAG